MQKNLTIKELPNTERPYEKCLLYGAGSLSDAELISVIIRTGSRGERCVDLAHRILNAGPDGLLNLIRLDTEQLTGIRGIGPVKAVQLKCCLLYTSDAADEEDSVDLGGRRIIKKKEK